ncbi:hypothetical protein [Streptomyces sp. NPDC057552]|uniref:hypothetical protein n=1 Tax=Streptomyces sp. NPDC057552 TaxID=3350537 RepID=UPI00367AB2D6
MALSIEEVHPAKAVRDLDEAPLVRHSILPLPGHWGDLTFELRNHIEGWITVIRGSQTADTGHPLLLAGGWISPPRESGATAVLHPRLEEAEVALGRALADAVTVTACTTKSWDDNNRIAVAQEAGTARWMAAWLHNGVPGFTEHDSWKAAQTDAARQLDAMADSFILTGDTYTAAIASAHLRRCANQVRAQVFTADLGNVIRSHKEEMQNERRVTTIANGLGVQRPFLYRVFKGTEWTQ